jgi:hypothetical protein
MKMAANANNMKARVQLTKFVGDSVILPRRNRKSEKTWMLTGSLNVHAAPDLYCRVQSGEYSYTPALSVNLDRVDYGSV